MESQHALQLKILARLNELGMHAILPGFQGNVPMQMGQIFPKVGRCGVDVNPPFPRALPAQKNGQTQPLSNMDGHVNSLHN